MLSNERYQKYFEEYENYSSNNCLGNNYLTLGKKIFETQYYQIIYYKKSSFSSIETVDINKIFLIVPSIFNSPEILFLAKSKSFVENLRSFGEVFLINWLEINNADYFLEDYVNKVIEVVQKLRKKNIKTLNLIGHCIGGNLALAASIIAPNLINTLTLLSTPWDFSHFSIVSNLYKHLNIDTVVLKQSLVPKLYIKILFFLLFPNHLSKKLDKFLTLNLFEDKDLFFRIEHWLLSGVSLPRGTYLQIIQNLIGENMLLNTKWKINNILIDPGLLDLPVYQIIATEDKIVPISSSLALHHLCKQSTMFEIAGGHISYLINNTANDLFKKFAI